jgi:hypothetical protein
MTLSGLRLSLRGVREVLMDPNTDPARRILLDDYLECNRIPGAVSGESWDTKKKSSRSGWKMTALGCKIGNHWHRFDFIADV